MPPTSSAPPPPARGDDLSHARSSTIERSAGGVVVRGIEGVSHVLLIRDPYHKWGLPKGHLENGERPYEAALREVSEETGLDDLVLGPDLGEIDWTFQLKGRRIHKFCRFFLMASFRGECRPEVEEGISACRWLPGPEALKTVTYDNAREIIRRALDLMTSGGPPDQTPWSRG